MPIDEFKRYHGFALAEFLDNRFVNENREVVNVPITRLKSSVNYVYIIDGDCALYFKYSRSNRSPWQFSFTETHIKELRFIESLDEVRAVFLVLICGFEAIAVLNNLELMEVISLEKDNPQSIRITTYHNRSLRVSGTQGRLNKTLPKTKPFEKIYEFLEK